MIQYEVLSSIEILGHITRDNFHVHMKFVITNYGNLFPKSVLSKKNVRALRLFYLLTLSGTVGRLSTILFVLVFFIFPIDFDTLSKQIYTY